MFVSYAQNFEDVMLWRALKTVERGCYIDIGAQDPVSDSVSKAFHNLGWRGTSVEPTSGYADALRADRPDETIVQALVGAGSDTAIIYEIAGTGLSTMSPELAAKHAAAGHKVEMRTVECISLDEILDRHKGREVHWLKIDTEGSEDIVIGSWSSSAVRPWIILVESVDPVTREINSASWEPSLLARGYRSVHFDGLNTFYLHEAHEDLAPAFCAPPNVFDHFSLSGMASSAFCARPNQDRLELAQKVAQMVEIEKQQIDEISTLSSRNADLDAGLAKAAAVVAAADAERARLHHQIESQAQWWQERMAEVHRSTSWRITWPLRLISRVMRKIVSVLRGPVSPARQALSFMRRAAGALLRRAAGLARRRMPGLFYRLATNRLVRRLYSRLTPRTTMTGVAYLAPALSLTQSATAVDTRHALEAGLDRWSSGRRIDA